MKSMNHVFNHWTFTAAVPAMAGDWQQALSFMDELLHDGILPNEAGVNELTEVSSLT